MARILDEHTAAGLGGREPPRSFIHTVAAALAAPELTGPALENWQVFREVLLLQLILATFVVYPGTLLAGAVGGSTGHFMVLVVVLPVFYGLNTLYYVIGRRRPRWLAAPYLLTYFVLGVDVLFATLGVYYVGGGAHMLFGVPLYWWIVFYSVALLSSRGAWVMAVLASASYASMVLAVGAEWIPEQPGFFAFTFAEGWRVMSVVSNTIGLGVIAFVGGLVFDVRRRETARRRALEAELRIANQELVQSARALETANAALAATNARLEGVNRELELYTRAVSHDVRSPVAAAGEALRLLEGSPAEERGRLARLVAESIARADHMLLGLRDLMRGAGTPEPTQVVATRALLEGLIEEVRGAGALGTRRLSWSEPSRRSRRNRPSWRTSSATSSTTPSSTRAGAGGRASR